MNLTIHLFPIKFEVILSSGLVKQPEAHCQNQWLDHSVHFRSGLLPSGMPHGVLLPGTLDGSPFAPGGKSNAKPEGTFVGWTNMPGGHIRVSRSFPLAVPSQKVIITEVGLRTTFSKTAEIKTYFVCRLEFFFSHFKVWDPWWLLLLFIMPKENACLVNVIQLSWSCFFTLIVF